MDFSFAKFFQLSADPKSVSGSRQDIVFVSILALAAFLALLLVIDGYLFYISYLRPRPRAISAGRSVSLSPQDIDEAVRLLDEREQKLQILLGGGE